MEGAALRVKKFDTLLRLRFGKTERDVHAAALDLEGVYPRSFFDSLRGAFTHSRSPRALSGLRAG